jgi:transposase-like protein
MAADADPSEGSNNGGEAYYQSIREQRFDGAVACLECSSTDVITRGLTTHEVRQYVCQACQAEFTDLTGTVFDGQSLSVEAILYIHQHNPTRSTRLMAEALDCSQEAIQEAQAALKKSSPAIDVDSLCDVQTIDHSTPIQTHSETPEPDEDLSTSQRTNQYVDVRVLEPSRRRLRAWKDERNLTYDTAINKLLDLVATADLSLGPDDAPETEAQTDENRVIISMRRDTRDRLNLWKTERGFTYNEALLVLLDRLTAFPAKG